MFIFSRNFIQRSGALSFTKTTLAAAIFAGLSACSSLPTQESPFVGTWACTSSDTFQDLNISESFTFTAQADQSYSTTGSLSFDRNGSFVTELTTASTGTWAITDEQTLALEIDRDFTLKATDDVFIGQIIAVATKQYVHNILNSVNYQREYTMDLRPEAGDVLVLNEVTAYTQPTGLETQPTVCEKQ